MSRRVLIASMVLTCAATSPVWAFELLYTLSLSRSDLPQPWPPQADPHLPQLAVDALWAAEVDADSVTRLWVGNCFDELWRPHWAPNLLAKLLAPRRRGLGRVFHEAALSVWLSRHGGVADLKRALAQSAYLGRGAVGLEQGAWAWFGRDVSQLGVAELALLADLAQGPGLYDPVTRPDRARERRTWVLERMLDHGEISFAQFEAASNAPLDVVRECRGRVCADDEEAP